MAATWGTNVWGANSWESETVAASLTGFSVTSSLGTLAYAGSVEGWGRDAWGDNNWGENATDVILTGFEISGSIGPDTWGTVSWGNSTWGGDPFALTTITEMALGITGFEATGSVGTPQINYDFKITLTDSLLMSVGIGTLSSNDGADHTQGLASLLVTGSLGTIGHEMAYDLTGFEVTGSLGSLTITSARLVNITASLLATGSLGSPTVDDMAIGLSGFSSTMSLGTLPTIDDMAVGLTGLSITGSVGQAYAVHYAKDSITGSTAYSVDTHANTSYTVEKHIPN